MGDFVEFTRLEAHELSFDGVRHGKDAIAKVLAYKERKDEEAKKGVGKNRTAAAPFWHATNLVNSGTKVYLQGRVKRSKSRETGPDHDW